MKLQRITSGGVFVVVVVSTAITFLPVFATTQNEAISTTAAESNGALHEIEISAVPLNGQLAYKMVSHLITDEDGDTVDVTDRYPDQATVPGPTIVLTEGDTVDVTLINDIGEGIVSIHPHGIHYEITSDGTYEVINGVSDQGAEDGGSISYHWEAGEGTAGTWPYHDHMFGTINGAEVQGLFGTIIVNPGNGRIDALVDGMAGQVNLADISKEFVMYITDDAFWAIEIGSDGEHVPLWSNPTLVAADGNYVRFHLIGLGTDFHQFHLNGYEWLDPGTAQIIDEKTIGPLENHVFVVNAETGETTYEDSLQSHLLMGMEGLFRVTAGGGDSIPGPSPIGGE